MELGELKRWVCTACWTLRSRAEVEAAAAQTDPATEVATWRCRGCGRVGRFVDENDPQFSAMMMERLYETNQARLREAGWPVLSLVCGLSQHSKCAARAEDGELCDCACHQ